MEKNMTSGEQDSKIAKIKKKLKKTIL